MWERSYSASFYLTASGHLENEIKGVDRCWRFALKDPSTRANKTTHACEYTDETGPENHGACWSWIIKTWGFITVFYFLYNFNFPKWIMVIGRLKIKSWKPLKNHSIKFIKINSIFFIHQTFIQHMQLYQTDHWVLLPRLSQTYMGKQLNITWGWEPWCIQNVM